MLVMVSSSRCSMQRETKLLQAAQTAAAGTGTQADGAGNQAVYTEDQEHSQTDREHRELKQAIQQLVDCCTVAP